ncbi:MAG TPA: hypothetical protein EYO59_04750 [Chromatiaceae bacterium]|nr:hypothetical protein [Chromatiaceae bacterium]
MKKNKVMEKYVAAALEGYEQNYAGISEAITTMEQQLSTYKTQQSEMLKGITEMKELLGLAKEDEAGENVKSANLKIVNDGTAIE